MSQLFPVAYVILAGISPALQVSKVFPSARREVTPTKFIQNDNICPHGG